MREEVSHIAKHSIGRGDIHDIRCLWKQEISQISVLIMHQGLIKKENQLEAMNNKNHSKINRFEVKNYKLQQESFLRRWIKEHFGQTSKEKQHRKNK